MKNKTKNIYDTHGKIAKNPLCNPNSLLKMNSKKLIATTHIFRTTAKRSNLRFTSFCAATLLLIWNFMGIFPVSVHRTAAS